MRADEKKITREKEAVDGMVDRAFCERERADKNGQGTYGRTEPGAGAEERKIQALKRMIRYAGELLLVLFVFCALMQHVWIGQVQGASMRPTYQDGQFILLLRGKEYNRGDVVGVEYSAGEEKTTLLKRIIAIGGDVVSCKYGQLYVNGQKVSESDHTVGKTSDITAQTIPDGSVYLLGDNREHSMDSRSFGCMSCEDIIGKVVH